MTYLELCKAVCREAGIPNGENAISAVTSQTGELQRIVNYVKSAWKETQNMYQSSGQYWRWMRRGFTLTLSSGTAEYAYTDATDDVTAAAIARFRKWTIDNPNDPPKIYLTSGGVGGEGWLHFIDWDSFKYLYRIGTQNNGQPIHVTISPQNKLVFGPTPDDTYTVTGDFLLSAQELSAAGDEPECPSSFHDLIVWAALKRYGLFESAPECVTMGEHFEKKFLGDLIDDQLSGIELAGALV